MIGIFNGTGSGKVVKVYRVTALNNQTVAVAGVNVIFKLVKISTGSGGLYLTPVKHDSTSPVVPSQVVCATNMSYTTSGLLRNLYWSNDEPLQTTATTNDEFELIPKFQTLWESSYKDTSVQPIILREGQGVALTNSTATAVGIADFFIEFTME
jgi:ribosomal protein L24